MKPLFHREVFAITPARLGAMRRGLKRGRLLPSVHPRPQDERRALTANGFARIHEAGMATRGDAPQVSVSG